jgi:3-dehydroquinate synthase
MVDAAIGGKTGVNVPAGKNLVGCFHQPESVYADPDTLGTLPARRYAEGLAEVVKTAVVADAGLFAWLERSARALVARDPVAVERAIVAASAAKLRIVAADERDRGARHALNFGHTVGHAIEAASRYTMSHGQAVAIGLAAEARIAVRRTGLSRADAERVERLIAALGLPLRLPDRIPVGAVLDAARQDKKSRRGAIRCALPTGIGRPGTGTRVTVAVTRAELGAALGRRVD